MVFGETVAVYCENHTERTDKLCGRMQRFSVLKQVVHIVTTGLEMVIMIFPTMPRLSKRSLSYEPQYSRGGGTAPCIPNIGTG
jgi:hypothetical protein